MTTSIRSLLALACLALASPILAQSPPVPTPVEPPPVLDPASPPPVLDPSAPPMDDRLPVDAPAPVPTPDPTDNAAQLELDRARLSCQTMPEQQRQACLDAAQRAFEQARRRGDDPVR